MKKKFILKTKIKFKNEKKKKKTTKNKKKIF